MLLKNIERVLNNIGPFIRENHVSALDNKTILNISYKLKNVVVFVQNSGTNRATCSLSVRNINKPGDARFDDIGDVCFVSKLKYLAGTIKTKLE